MRRDHVHLGICPFHKRQRIGIRPDNEEALVGGHHFAVGKLQGVFPASDFGTEISALDPGFFPQFTKAGLCKCLARLDPAARRCPVASALQRPVSMDKSKQQQFVLLVEYKQFCRGSLPHCSFSNGIILPGYEDINM